MSETFEIINKMETKRTSNNHLWMDVLRLAVRYAPPEKTSAVIRQIHRNDGNIGADFVKLADALDKRTK